MSVSTATLIVVTVLNAATPNVQVTHTPNLSTQHCASVLGSTAQAIQAVIPSNSMARIAQSEVKDGWTVITTGSMPAGGREVARLKCVDSGKTGQ